VEVLNIRSTYLTWNFLRTIKFVDTYQLMRDASKATEASLSQPTGNYPGMHQLLYIHPAKKVSYCAQFGYRFIHRMREYFLHKYSFSIASKIQETTLGINTKTLLCQPEYQLVQ